MSLREAINEKCKDCIFDPLENGRWKEQVAQCSCTDCPLYSVRPKPRRKNIKLVSFRELDGVTNIKPLGRVEVFWKNTNTVSLAHDATAFCMGVNRV